MRAFNVKALRALPCTAWRAFASLAIAASSPSFAVVLLMLMAMALGTCGVFLLWGVGWCFLAASLQVYIFGLALARALS